MPFGDLHPGRYRPSTRFLDSRASEAICHALLTSMTTTLTTPTSVSRHDPRARDRSRCATAKCAPDISAWPASATILRPLVGPRDADDGRRRPCGRWHGHACHLGSAAIRVTRCRSRAVSCVLEAHDGTAAE